MSEHRSRRPALWWIGALFAVGSLCFLVGPLPGFVQLVGERADAGVFFVGSLFFTGAAGWQWAISPLPRGPLGLPRRRWRSDRGSSALQFAGTIFFNATTFYALTTAPGDGSYDRLVWRPDAFGSVCFLASGALAYVLVTGALTAAPPRTRDGGIATVNLLGCLAFLLSAVAAFVLPTSREPVNVHLVNAATSLGALGFLIGAVLQMRGNRVRPAPPAVRPA
jgi:hypothetical protein